MSAEQIVEAGKNILAGNLPVAVGLAAGAVALAAAYAVGRRARPAAPAPIATDPAAEDAFSWAPPEQSYADRRGAVRRDGAAVRVVVASDHFRNGAAGGLVVDRSTGGLGLLMPAAVAPGTTLRVRAANAPDTVGFVPVIVRSCRPTGGDHFEVGCEFEKTPPWSVLLLFG